MTNTIRNLLFLCLLFFSISYDCFTAGIAYDNKHKLYSEYDGYCCTFRKVYGKRWERLGFASFLLGTGFTLALFVSWRRNKPLIRKELSIIQGDINSDWKYRT